MGHLRPWAIAASFNNEDFIDEIDGLGEALADYYYRKNPLQRLWSWVIGEGAIIHKILDAAQDFYYQNKNEDTAAAWTFYQKFERLAHKNSHGVFTLLRQELTELLTQQLGLFAIQAQTNYAELLRNGFKKSSGSPKSAKTTAELEVQATTKKHWWSKPPAPIITAQPTPKTITPPAGFGLWSQSPSQSLKDSVKSFTLASKERSSTTKSSKSSSHSSNTPASLIRVYS